MTYPWEDELPWADDYIEVGRLLISDDEYDRLLTDHPDMIRSWEDDCPTCQGHGKFFWDGEMVECDCRTQVLLHKQYLHANIGIKYQRLSWGAFVGDLDAKNKVAGFIAHHQGHVRRGLGVMLHGEFGTGKTLLLTLAGKAFVRLGYSVYFATFPEIINMFTAGWKSNEERSRFERRIVHSTVLLIDDVGKEWDRAGLPQATLDDVIRRRVAANRSTFITTNIPRPNVADRYGGGAIASLLREACVQFTVRGEDYRDSLAHSLMEESKKGWVRPIS